MLKTLVLADIHYTDGDKKIIKKMDKLFNKYELEHIVFLGDTFEFYFEYGNRFYKHNDGMMDFIKKISQRFLITFVRGNHDIFIDGYFKEQIPSAQIYDNLVLNSSAGEILLFHGHRIHDESFLKKFFYFILENRLDKFLYSLLPESIGYDLGVFVSKMISVRNVDRLSNIKLIEKKYNTVKYEKYKKIIISHFHMNYVSKDKRILFLGDFKNLGSYILIDDKGVHVEHI